jgi:hypothetical protein
MLGLRFLYSDCLTGTERRRSRAGTKAERVRPRWKLGGRVNTVVRLTPDDWQMLRDLRLRALQDAPDAITASYDDELACDEASWRDRARTGQWFVALTAWTRLGSPVVSRAGQVTRPSAS